MKISRPLTSAQLRPTRWPHILLVGIAALTTGCSSRADVVLMLDSSQSSLPHRDGQLRVVNQVLTHLNPGHDHVSIYRLSERVEILYSGDPAPKSIHAALDEYIRLGPSEYGTAYGTALQTGIDELRRLHAKRQAAGEENRSALMFLGDAADEPIRGQHGAGARMTDELLQETGRLMPKTGMLAFLFAEPRWSSRIYSALSVPLEGRLLLAPPPSVTQPGTLMQIFTHLQR